MNKRKTVTAFGAALGLGVGLWTVWNNKRVKLTHHEIKNKKISSAMSGCTIVHISDFHNTLFGENHQKLVDKIRITTPDLIAVTGDLLDSRTTKMEVAISFIEELVKVAPVYYVSGNHESRIPEYEAFERNLRQLNVTVLNNERIEVKVGMDSFQLHGVKDPAFGRKERGISEREVMADQLNKMNYSANKYTVLLSHRPELIDLYAEYPIDLILSGHAHGGQIRLPFVGGLLAPNQGFFPLYTSGLYLNKQTSLIVSRGIGNSAFPLRFNNPPEVVVIRLFTNR